MTNEYEKNQMALYYGIEYKELALKIAAPSSYR